MGLLGKLKKKVAGAAEDVARRTIAPVSGYAGRLKTNIKAELADPTSEGYKFAHAPAGQYYLPGPVKKAAGFVLPTPAETVASNKEFIQKPGLKTGLRAGLTNLAIVSAPAMATGAAALPGAARKGAAMIAERGIGRTLASESGARVFKGIAAKKAAGPVMDTAARSERVGAKITGERVASVGLADEAADLAAASRLQKVPTDALRSSNSAAAKQELLRRLESAPGKPGGLSRVATSPEAIARAGIETTKAPRSRIAGAVGVSNRSVGGLKAAAAAPAAKSAAPLAARVPSEVAQQGAASVFQKMPDVALGRMANQGVSGAQLEAARRAAAALKPKPALGAAVKPAGPVTATEAKALNVAKPAVSETVSTAQKGGGLGMPSKTQAQAVATAVKAAAPKAKIVPKGSNPAYTRRPGKITTKQLSELLASRTAQLPAPKRAPGGSTAGAPRGAAVKRAAGSDFEAALAAAGEKPTGSVAAKAVRSTVPETGIHPGTGKPVKLTQRGTIAESDPLAEAIAKADPLSAAIAKAEAPLPKSTVKGARKTPKASKTPETPKVAPAAVATAESVAKRSAFSRVKGAGKFTLKSAKVAAQVSLPVAAGGVLLSQRGGGASATNQNATPTPGADEIGLRAVAEVAKKKGKRGTSALVAGLAATRSTKGLIASQFDPYLREAVRRAYEANK